MSIVFLLTWMGLFYKFSSRQPLKLNAPSAQLANNFIHHEEYEEYEEYEETEKQKLTGKT